MSQYQAIVIGAGLSGAVMAERMANQLNWRVLVIEQRPHIGGNCFDEYDPHGVLVHRYGPHLFHTDNPEVWQYLSQFTKWHQYQHKVVADIDGKLVPIPFNLNSIDLCFPSERAAMISKALLERFGEGSKVPILKLRQESNPLLVDLADFVYDKVFVNYTTKQWGVTPEKIAAEVTARVPVVVSRDDHYFSDPWQAVPKQGYRTLFERMLSHPNIEVQLSTPMSSRIALDWDTNTINLDGRTFNGPLVYTGMLDKLMSDSASRLSYRSLRFEFTHLQRNRFQTVATVNYPNSEAYTRITEFKHLTGQNHPGTTIVREYPATFAGNTDDEPYYPMFTAEDQNLYRDLAERLVAIPQIIALGRLAQYRYFDMDDAVANALAQFDEHFAHCPSSQRTDAQ